jgi:hypothetical protein
MDDTTNELELTAPTATTRKKRRGPLSYSERLAEVRAVGKAHLAKLEQKLSAKMNEVDELTAQVRDLRAELGYHEDDAE